MLLTNTEVATMTVAHLGQTTTIQDIENDNTKAAVIIRTHFRGALYQLLNKYIWKSYTRRKLLALKDMPDKNSYWTYTYIFPEDALRITKIYPVGSEVLNTRLEYDPEYEDAIDDDGQRVIRSRVPNAKVDYVLSADWRSGYEPHFANALAAQLALLIAPSFITNNFAQMKNVLTSNMNNIIYESLALDTSRDNQASEQRSIDTYISGRW